MKASTSLATSAQLTPSFHPLCRSRGPYSGNEIEDALDFSVNLRNFGESAPNYHLSAGTFSGICGTSRFLRLMERPGCAEDRRNRTNDR